MCPCIKVKIIQMTVIIIRRISLLNVPGKLYGRVLMERLREVTEGRLARNREGLGKKKDVWIFADICS